MITTLALFAILLCGVYNAFKKYLGNRLRSRDS